MRWFYLAVIVLVAVATLIFALQNFSLGVLGGSPRRLHDFNPAAVKLPFFAPP